MSKAQFVISPAPAWFCAVQLTEWTTSHPFLTSLLRSLSIQFTINSCMCYPLNMSLIGPPLSVFIATTLVQAINIFYMDHCFCLHSVYPLTQDRLCQSVFLLCSQSWSFQNQNLLLLISLARPPSGLHCSWVGTWACNVTSTALHCLASAYISRPFLHHIPSSHTSPPPPPGMCRTSFLHKPWTATYFPKLCCLLTLSWANL